MGGLLPLLLLWWTTMDVQAEHVFSFRVGAILGDEGQWRCRYEWGGMVRNQHVPMMWYLLENTCKWRIWGALAMTATCQWCGIYLRTHAIDTSGADMPAGCPPHAYRHTGQRSCLHYNLLIVLFLSYVRTHVYLICSQREEVLSPHKALKRCPLINIILQMLSIGRKLAHPYLLTCILFVHMCRLWGAPTTCLMLESKVCCSWLWTTSGTTTAQWGYRFFSLGDDTCLWQGNSHAIMRRHQLLKVFPPACLLPPTQPYFQVYQYSF